MEFEIQKVLKTNIEGNSTMAVLEYQDCIAYVVCAGAGALLVPFDKTTYAKHQDQQKFLYESPGTSTLSEFNLQISPSASPTGSPRSSPVPKLTRPNKSKCLDANSNSHLVAMGESGGYMPRLLLFNLTNGETSCVDFLRDQHSFGIEFVKFSPSGKFLLSLGSSQDGYLYIYDVSNSKFEVCATNKCISEVRDVCWINECQFVTVGVRHIKVWTFENRSIHGRNIVLGPLIELTFDCVTASNLKPDNTNFLVGASNGCIYEMPDALMLVDTQELRPFTAITTITNTSSVSEYPLVAASTSTNLYIFEDGFSNIKQLYEFGANALYSYNSKLHAGRSTEDIDFLCNVDIENSNFDPLKEAETKFKHGLKLKGCDNGEVVCWYIDDHQVIRWPSTTIGVNLENVTCAWSQKKPHELLLVGSLSGDVSLNNQVHAAHNGPVTDCHVLKTKAISGGRDRLVKIWNYNAESRPEWSLCAQQTFSTPILKTQICVNSLGEFVYVSFGSNKTLYFSIIDDYNLAGDQIASARSLKSVATRGMAYDLKSIGNLAVLSTNDRMISIYNAFGESNNKLQNTWKPRDPNGEAINLIYIQPFKHENSFYLLGAGSNKCVMLYSLTTGEIVASQWGHSDAITGVAWNGKDIISASDNIFVSQLVPKKPEPNAPLSPTRSNSPLRSPIRSKSPVSRPQSSANSGSLSPTRHSPLRIPRSPTADSVSMSPNSKLPKLTDPKLNPFNHSPPAKPILSPNGVARSSSPTPASPKPQPPTQPTPQLHRPTSPLRRPASPQTSTGTLKPKIGGFALADLENQLKSFISTPKSTTADYETVKALMISALIKIDGLSFADVISEKVYDKIEEKLNK